MRTRWSDADRVLAAMEDLRRRVDQLFGTIGEGGLATSSGWPRIGVFDNGSALIVTAEVPGLTKEDVEITIHQDVLTLSGDRHPDAPDAYSAHRQERSPAHFARTIPLPCRVLSEQASASIAHGVLTITIPKAPEARPRLVAVRPS